VSDSAEDPHTAFRAGVLGWRFARRSELLDHPMPHGGFAFGPNEGLAVAARRLPGLAEARPAFESGRALRAIAKLLDRARAPEAIGRQFIDNLAAAALSHLMRRSKTPWGAEDTVDMFMEMYERILTPEPEELAQVRAVLLAYARDESAQLPKGGG
jgi:hypothetical protein